MRSRREHPFERELAVPLEDISLVLRGHSSLPWADFLLNPRRLRGSDFLMRWSQGLWSETALQSAVEETNEFLCLAYGPSGTAPTDDPRSYELYFERLENAGLADLKRPDLLVFRCSSKDRVRSLVASLGGVAELPFASEIDPRMQELIELSILAIECENSLWIAEQMPAFNKPMRPQKRLNGALGYPKNAVLPTVILKEEDRSRLLDWQASSSRPIHIWHCFYDRGFGLALDDAERLIRTGAIQPTVQTYQAPGGATTHKTTYRVYHTHAYPLCTTTTPPSLVAKSVTDANGHILPYVSFQGGTLTLDQTALTILRSLAAR